MPDTTPAPGAPITPAAGSAISDLLASPAVRHVAQTLLSFVLAFGAAYLSSKLGITVTPPVITIPQ